MRGGGRRHSDSSQSRAEMASDAIDALVAKLPREIRERAEAIPVRFDPVPSEEIIAEGFEPDILGLFVGRDHAETGGDLLPPEILIFVDNIHDYVDGDRREFVEEVRRTYLHELGHYLGLDEADLEDRDLD